MRVMETEISEIGIGPRNKICEKFETNLFKKAVLTEASLLQGARKFLEENKFVEVVVPHLVSATGSCEVIETLFEVPYFDRTAFLTQTAQLYLEAVVPFLGGKVWTFGPSFRAESRVDNRHLTEFSLLELEFEGDFQLLLNTIEEMFVRMIFEANRELAQNMKIPFRRMSYSEAIGRLGLAFGMDIQSSDEQKLLEQNKNQPMFLTHFPKELKYFNMRENDSNSKLVNSADFIVPHGGECAGAAEREYNPARLLQRLQESAMFINYKAKGGNPHAFDWYINSYFKHNYSLHSGFGMGLNRVTKYVLQLEDIRDSTAYPVNKELLY